MPTSLKKPAAALLAVAATAALISAVPADAGVDSGSDRLASTNLRGKFEIPGPGDEDGRGQFAAVISKRQLCYSLTAHKIEPPTAAHIHMAPPDEAGDVVVTLLTPTRKGVSECIDPVPDEEDTTVTLSESELEAIRTGREGFYVNVHNEPFPAGAIRGQLH